MTALADEDDRVVAAALAVLDGDAPEGTENVRRVTDAEVDYVYRIVPETEGTVDADDVTAGGEFPASDAASWRATRDEVEREVERRGLASADDTPEGPAGGNRDEGNRDR